MQIEHVARTSLLLAGRTIPPGHVIPPELMRGRNLAPWVRQGLIEVRGPGAAEAKRMYRSMEPPPLRAPQQALIRQAEIAGQGDADKELENPLLEVDDEYGEALERSGHTVEDAEAAAAAGVELENEGEVQARLAEGVIRRRKRRR